MYITRTIEKNLTNSLNRAKIVIIYGARQVGKTTMLKNIFPETTSQITYLACDKMSIQEQLKPDDTILKQILGETGTVIFDEMQTLENPGLILKIIYDHLPGIKAIATGSSAFDLANKLSEPLTGRHEPLWLYPFSFAEISTSVSPFDLENAFKNTLLYGSYPKIFNQIKTEDKIRELSLLTENYLYKDILTFDLVKNNKKIRELLLAIALQLGNEVSYNELGAMLGLNRLTIERYLDLLEKSFVLFRLYGFNRNLRNEINRKVKIYFFDCGVRNALINNFNPLEMRTDSGALFENFIVSEIYKKNSLSYPRANLYFWRTHTGQEVDLIMEKNGQLTALECKLSIDKPTSSQQAFVRAYPGAQLKTVSWNNFQSVRELLG